MRPTENVTFYCDTFGDIQSCVGLAVRVGCWYNRFCLFVCAGFFSAVFDPILIKLGHMLYVWV